MNYQLLDTPIGTLRLVSKDGKLARVEFQGQHQIQADERLEGNSMLEATAKQLGEYFAGERQHFELSLNPCGTPFQQEVWASLQAIPFGEVRSYKDIAHEVGRPKAVRAVGAANGRNPIPIIVPCHRVIGSDGSLTGFAGGLETKKLLLKLEGALPTTND
ncbi:MAG: methylated-DNA--[protein]-cysteine S-methyltransferase [Halioglobus sp.]